MKSFEFYSPTRVLFGSGVENQVGVYLAKLGAKKALIHYGGGSVVRSGLLDRVKSSLLEKGISFVELGGVKPNPILSLAKRGARLCMDEQVDFILAVGGGSVIDSAKAISYGATYPEVDLWDFFLRKSIPEKHLPVGCVPTIAAAGSEMSSSCVITNEETRVKRGLDCEANRPVISFLNPELLYTLPSFQIACGVSDILMHTLERYFTPVLGNELSDQIAEGLLRTVIKYGPIQYREPDNYDAVSEIMWAGSLSHNHLTGLGGAGDWATHQLSHELSAMFDVAHGAALTSVWGSWARYVYQNNSRRFAQFARQIWGESAVRPSDDETAQNGIILTEQFFSSLGMPVGIRQLLGRVATEQELLDLSERCTYFRTRTIGNFRVLGYEDILAVYREANVR